MENKTAPYNSEKVEEPATKQISDLKHRNSAVINYISKTKKSVHKLKPDLEHQKSGSVFKSSLHASNGF